MHPHRPRHPHAGGQPCRRYRSLLRPLSLRPPLRVWPRAFCRSPVLGRAWSGPRTSTWALRSRMPRRTRPRPGCAWSSPTGRRGRTTRRAGRCRLCRRFRRFPRAGLRGRARRRCRRPERRDPLAPTAPGRSAAPRSPRAGGSVWASRCVRHLWGSRVPRIRSRGIQNRRTLSLRTRGPRIPLQLIPPFPPSGPPKPAAADPSKPRRTPTTARRRMKNRSPGTVPLPGPLPGSASGLRSTGRRGPPATRRRTSRTHPDARGPRRQDRTRLRNRNRHRHRSRPCHRHRVRRRSARPARPRAARPKIPPSPHARRRGAGLNPSTASSPPSGRLA